MQRARRALRSADASTSIGSTSPRKLARTPSASSADSPGDRRSSARSEPLATALERVADLFLSPARVVIVTGAGISVASGIPPFRGSADAVWETSVWEWGTKRKFLEDPRAWYDAFWLPQFKGLLGAAPNPAHEAIAQLTRAFPERVSVVTQNIDRLHSAAPWAVADSNLIEIHGRMDQAKCFTARCPFESAQTAQFSAPVQTSADVPLCAHCGAVVAPNALLFDEQYDAHASYQFEKAMRWLEEADAIVFCGTSFSVRLTDMCFEALSDKAGARAFNFNVDKAVPRGKTRSVPVHSVVGKCEETLPALWALIQSRRLALQSAV